MPKLTYTDVNGESRELRFNRRVTIGRHPSQDLQLLDRVVSKEHAFIEERTGHFVLRDNGSRNGMQVNGEQVSGSRILNHLDKVATGTPVVVFFPGSYRSSDRTGMTLNLFGIIDDDNYYRAINIMEVK